MKTIILCNSSAGLYKFRKELVYALREGGHAVAIVAPDGDYRGQFEDKGCSFAVLPMERRGTNVFKDLKLIRRYKAILKAEKPDIVLTYTIKPNIYGGIAAKKLGIPYFTFITGLGKAFEKKGLLNKLVVNMYKSALVRAQAVFFENQDNKIGFTQNKIITDAQAVVLNGAGVNLCEFDYKSLTGDEKDVLFIGRIMREKGIEEFFCAAEQLKERYPDKIFGVLGDYEEKYKDRVEELQAKGIIRFYGFQKDVRAYIEKSLCVVLPSYHEGMSNVLLEAAATGRPLITSDIPGCREAVEDGVNGFLCAAKNASALTATLDRFLQLDHEQIKSMGRSGRERMEKIFDRQIVVARTLSKIERRPEGRGE